MSTTILRHCDRCKKEIPATDQRQIWVVQVLVANEEDYTSRNSSALRLYEKTNPLRQEWCRPCADALNLVGGAWKPPAGNPTTTPPTFEDQLREIIQDEISASRES
jgi:hypothetical protein